MKDGAFYLSFRLKNIKAPNRCPKSCKRIIAHRTLIFAMPFEGCKCCLQFVLFNSRLGAQIQLRQAAIFLDC